MGRFTVLMAVYHKDSPELFGRALNSVFTNTLKPDLVIVVADGPLTDEINTVIDKFIVQYSALKILRLKKNLGLARALNEGLKHVDTEWVVRADSDDINHRDRFQKLVETLNARDGELDILGSAVQEIEADGSPIAVRRTSSGQINIRNFAARRNPFNHMTVMFRTACAKKVGGYPDIYLREDYGLWASMLKAGARCENLYGVTVDAVAGDSMYKRRGGIKYACAEIKLQKHLYQCDLKSWPQAMLDGFLRALVFLMPVSLRSVVYKYKLRR